jgi:hypothetical protein
MALVPVTVTVYVAPGERPETQALVSVVVLVVTTVEPARTSRVTAVPPARRDEFMQATLWPRGHGVISHDTALGELWDLCGVNAAKVHVTIPATARIRRAVPRAYAVHARALDPADVTRVGGIPVVTVRRAILDGIERHLGDRLIGQAIDKATGIGQLRGVDLEIVERARRASW